MKKVILPRSGDDGIETLGNFIIYGEAENALLTGDTIERPWKENQRGISCIPGGTYTCRWAFMNDLKEWHFQILDVPGRDGIFIHEGNFYKNFEGCIGIGKGKLDINGDSEMDVLNSRPTLAAFEKIMNKEDFQLTIIPYKQAA